MNLLGWICGFLLLFACMFSLSLHKFYLSAPIEKSLEANLKATRKILNAYEQDCFNHLRAKPASANASPETLKKSVRPRTRKIRRLNKECASLNLWPLLEEGREKQKTLYETAAQILRAFYQKPLFPQKARFEYALLDALIRAAQKERLDPNLSRLALEKLALDGQLSSSSAPLQPVYYQMLKGTKPQMHSGGYPSLLDYFCLEQKESKICLQHASLELYEALFGTDAASFLYWEVQESSLPLSQERIRDACRQTGHLLEDDFFDLIDLRRSHHSFSGKKVLVEKEGDVCLKKRLFLPTYTN